MRGELRELVLWPMWSSDRKCAMRRLGKSC